LIKIWVNWKKIDLVSRQDKPAIWWHETEFPWSFPPTSQSNTGMKYWQFDLASKCLLPTWG
jgi:hypothetical protein